MNGIGRSFNHRILVAGLFVLFYSHGWEGSSQTAVPAPLFYTLADFDSVKKFDTHIHLNTMDTAFIQQAKADNFHFLDIVDDRPFGINRKEQEKIALHQVQSFPGTVFYAATFSVRNWADANWNEQALQEIKRAMSAGAVAIKVWKNVGMEQKDSAGKFIMIDNPRFDPLLDYLAKNNIPLVAHLGEPKDCWLPLDKMVLHKGYYSQHPEYHMYVHPEYPSYDDHINARDHMLEKHPDLHFIGAHLGSLEWSLVELAKRLDKFSNMAVDLSRMPEIFLHTKNNRQQTRDFFIRYQDRLLYATDVQVAATSDPVAMNKSMHENRVKNWRFFATDDTLRASGIEGPFKGLQLPKEVVDKIYRKNAEKWLPGVLKKNG